MRLAWIQLVKIVEVMGQINLENISLQKIVISSQPHDPQQQMKNTQ